MGVKIKNNAFGVLLISINTSATSITLQTGQGANFPSLSAGDYFFGTLIDTSNNLEIVKVTARTGDVLTVVRAQEGSTARSYGVGDRIELRLTSQQVLDLITDAVNTSAALKLDLAGGTMTGQLVVPTIQTTGGAGGIAVDITNGGDLRFKNAANSGSANLYCDNDGELKTPNNLSIGGLLLGTSRVRTQKQRVQNSVGYTSLNVGSWTTLVSVSITVAEGSSCLVLFNGEQNSIAGVAWQWTALFRDSTQIGTTTIEVNNEGWNSNFHTHFWDDNLSAGTYTYSFKVYNGTNYCAWGEHSNPTIQVVEFAK